MSTLPLDPENDVRRAADRARTRTDWLDSNHSFSFGPHFDADNTKHGFLIVNNDDVVAAGAGFDTHPHRDTEIVTWVLQGSLVHQDSVGHHGVIHPGLAQRMSAGTGILHSERNDPWREPGSSATVGGSAPVRFVQMWVLPDEPGGVPGYEQRDVEADLRSGSWVTVASGMPRHDDVAATRIGNRQAALHAARLRPGGSVELPVAPYLHLFVARGAVVLEDAGALAEGDAVRFTATGGQRVTATEPAEILVWEMHAGRVA